MFDCLLGDAIRPTNDKAHFSAFHAAFLQEIGQCQAGHLRCVYDETDPIAALSRGQHCLRIVLFVWNVRDPNVVVFFEAFEILGPTFLGVVELGFTNGHDMQLHYPQYSLCFELCLR